MPGYNYNESTKSAEPSQIDIGGYCGKYKQQKLPIYVAFLDVKKAFDSVWHKGLFYKLFYFGIRGDIWYTLFNWYNRLSSNILWNGFISRSFPISQGVRQGAVLSPLLYAIYTSELLSCLESSGLGVHINSVFVGPNLCR